MSENAKLTRGSIRGHLVSQTLPMIIGVAAIMSIGLVDAYFIGQLGSDPLAAISFIFPVSVATSSLGVGMMVGINSVVARALGEGDVDKAARRANFGLILAVLAGAILGAALFVLIDPLFRLMQADEELMPLIRIYMQPYALGFPLIMAIMGVNGILRGQGEAKRTSYVSLTYAAANWVLDPILITGAFGFAGFGIQGAAFATIIGWAVGLAAALWLMRNTTLPLDLSLIRQCRKREQIYAIMKVAGPAAMSNSINPIGLSVLTALIAAEGSAAVAGFGAAGRVQSFAVVPLLGLSGSIGAIVGQNWGAGEFGRARQAMLGAGLFAIVWGLAIALVLALFGDWFGQFFSDDPEVIEEFALYLSIAAWGYAGFGVLITANGALNAVDKATYALVQSVARVFLITLPFAWFLRPAWGSSAIYAAELAANVIGGAVAAGVVWYVLTRRTTADKS
ncbi:MATE family efflux transporter [Altererythrobacter lutimaris]|uniref:MATE family efflux transporter n=1 Tax=Altererythrobacter lutimaris TaxID=2743979 RepID=A0A850HBF6_9SPHN|nr:MATE family efflux transporter [Altererythrobacter lutimaris]NVE94870.1 MATE family efflux transporter [Altererythrobacter lutimaris]